MSLANSQRFALSVNKQAEWLGSEVTVCYVGKWQVKKSSRIINVKSMKVNVTAKKI